MEEKKDYKNKLINVFFDCINNYNNSTVHFYL